MARSDPTDFTITVLEGPRAGQEIPLSDRMAPYRSSAGGSISYGRTQRTKLTYYPGNPDATQSTFGRVLEPTTINGIWKDRYLGTDGTTDLVELMEELVDSGVQLLVTWESRLNQGLLKSFNFQPGNPTGGMDNVAWSMAFEWNSDLRRGTATRRVNRGTTSMRDAIASLAGLVSDLSTSLTTVIDSFGNLVGSAKLSFDSTRQALEDLVKSIDPTVAGLTQAASQMASEDAVTARLANTASSNLANASTQGAQAAATLMATFTGAAVDTDDVPAIVEFELIRRKASDAAFEIIEEAYTQKLRVDALVTPQTFQKVTVAQGSDLRKLAYQFYGDSDLWRRIAKVNGIVTSTVPDDITFVLIPLGLPDAIDDGMVGAEPATS